MKLNHALHLTYCTNIHSGESWSETFEALQKHTLAVRERVSPSQPFGIGLRLSAWAARELNEPTAWLALRRWLDQHHCYVFTINGFPYGRFHGGRVKEQAYMPDWTQPERLEYTKLLFDLLARLVPPDIEGSVSTLPGSSKAFVTTPEELQIIRDNLWRCVEHIARVSQQTERKLHLGLEPEPLCVLENTRETILFFDRIRSEHHNDPRLREHLGVCYDTCHFAVEFEDPRAALSYLSQHGIKISKIQLSNALKVQSGPEAFAALKPFAEDVYLHQVVMRTPAAKLRFYKDLPTALTHEANGGSPDFYAPAPADLPAPHSTEWRIHYHVPLHTPAAPPLENTSDHLLGVLDVLAANPLLCSHLEIETYTWEVLPPELKELDVVDQLAGEYGWTLARLVERGLAQTAG
jgi:hypothetical protein